MSGRYKQNRLQQLRGFCKVIETGGVSKAADELRLTQPTVSLQVQALERELDVRLFERRGPKIEATFEGRMLYELARPLVSSFDTLKEDFRARRDNIETGRVEIAAGESTIQYVLPPTVDEFVRAHPGVSLSLNNVTGREGLEMLRQREVDFCVGPILDTPADIEFDPIVSFDPVLIAPLGHPLASVKRVTLGHISKYPLILPPRNLSTWRQVEVVFQKENLPYQVCLEVGGWEVIKRFVELGLGISIVMSICITGRERLEAIPVSKYFPQRTYGIVRLKATTLSPQAREFIRILEEKA